MNSFLYRIAKTYYSEYQSDIKNFTFVFPNRRAGIFFQKYLTQLIEKPIFSPDILTVNDCFFNASQWQVSDRTGSLFLLYRIYRELSHSDETFDSFMYWGEMLLADFNDVDKYRVEVKQIFTNVTELNEIGLIFNVFTPEQVEAIRHFWAHFVPVVEGKTKEDFIAAWRILLPLYEQFRKELLEKNSATEGMIFRDVADRLKAKENIDFFEGKKFVFVGFNALNPCERTLFAELQKRGQADFYWDYEAAELRDPDNQASRFYAENIRLFASRFSIEISPESLKEKDFELIAIPSAVGQAKAVYRLLKDLYPSGDEQADWTQTAVVLPDENLLVPLLHSLPENIQKINVTMGFPLSSTPVSGLIEQIFELQKRKRVSGGKVSFYHLSVSGILNHQYINQLCQSDVQDITSQMIGSNMIYVNEAVFSKNDLLKSIFTSQTDSLQFSSYLLNILKKLNVAWQNISDQDNNYQLECDFIYQYYTAINRMNDVMKQVPDDMEINQDTLFRLIRQLTAGISIPFEGEPLEGLQVMGMLETRGLDFENLIVCSFNEGIFPKKSPVNSFIPYNLRRAFELPTTEYQDSISAYNFYRLIHRTRRLFFLYDSRTEGMQSGEVSRYVHQLRLHYGVKFKEINLSYDVRFPVSGEISVKKTPEIIRKLEQYLADSTDMKGFSASSLNSYIDCPLQFYLTQVERIKEPEEVLETIEANMFGTLLHSVMEFLYQPWVGKLVQENDIEDILNHPLHIERMITVAFSEKYFKKGKDADVKLEGSYLLTARVIRKYVRQILQVDKAYAPFRYIQSEERCALSFPIYDGKMAVNLKGFIDRVDEKEGTIRILDYKSGSGDLVFKGLTEVFEHNLDKRPKFVLQTFLYSILYRDKTDGKPIIPGIFYIKNVFKKDFTTELIYKPEKNVTEIVTDFSPFEEEFCEKLTACLEEIFNPEIPFAQCTNTKPCEYCPYKIICRR